VVADHAVARRLEPGEAVQVVALAPGQLQGTGERPGDLRRRRPRASLLEPDDVVDGNAREIGEFLAPQPGRAPRVPGRQPGGGRREPVAPGPEGTPEAGLVAGHVSYCARAGPGRAPAAVGEGGTAVPAGEPSLAAGLRRHETGVMTIAFITGANRGLGFETARRLTELGQMVILGARDPERGAAAAARLGVRYVGIDVTDDASVAAAAEDIARHEGYIDTLINNAGIVGRHAPADALTAGDATEVFNTNVVSIVRVTSAFLPLLGKSSAPSIVNVTSGMGSFAATHDPDRIESTIVAPLYTASKAAVTMLTTQYAKALPGIRVNTADPGYTATDFNQHRGTQTVTEGTDAIVTLATEGPEAGTGRFIDRFGPVSW
jgi:NAD(P)-dependent dehydrogenase (short-subunit alcohol dehydrogenase family)